jgi:hypothetical protein
MIYENLQYDMIIRILVPAGFEDHVDGRPYKKGDYHDVYARVDTKEDRPLDLARRYDADNNKSTHIAERRLRQLEYDWDAGRIGHVSEKEWSVETPHPYWYSDKEGVQLLPVHVDLNNLLKQGIAFVEVCSVNI